MEIWWIYLQWNEVETKVTQLNAHLGHQCVNCYHRPGPCHKLEIERLVFSEKYVNFLGIILMWSPFWLWKKIVGEPGEALKCWHHFPRVSFRKTFQLENGVDISFNTSFSKGFFHWHFLQEEVRKNMREVTLDAWRHEGHWVMKRWSLQGGAPHQWWFLVFINHRNYRYNHREMV